MNSQRSSFRLSHIQQALLPKQIDAKIILQAFKLQQNKRIFSSNRPHQIIIQQKTKTHNKGNLLHVTGKQLPSFSPQIHRIKSQKKQLTSIKQVLQNPINNIFKVISEDNDSKYYLQQLAELKNIHMRSQFHLNNQINKGIFSHKDLETQFNKRALKSIRLQNSSQCMQYYQQMILNNPILYRKIINAYNTSKRQQQRQNFKTKKGFLETKRSTFCETKFVQKSSFSQMAKTHNDSKKFINFMQYRQFLMTINLSNKFLLYPQTQTYKAYICKGNNGLLMKSILKSRPWWIVKSHSEIQQCNLIWTEWKKPKILNSLRKNQKNYNKNEIKIIQINSVSKKRQYLLLAQKKKSNLQKILSKQDKLWLKYQKIPHFQNYLTISNKINEPNFQQISKDIFKEDQYTHIKIDQNNKMHNHLPGCLNLHSKKLLFNNLRSYYEKLNKDIFSVIPLTFHITKGLNDPQFIKFSKYYKQQALIKSNTTIKINKNSNNIWIIKPGENSNRGNGITVLSKLSQIQALVSQKCTSTRSVIIQKYFENPFLYSKRKFDIRCYILITTVNGIIKGYWYQQGYLRTSSKQFNLKNLDNKFVHLTNDAIQKKGEQYGKFQNFNKISYKDFQKYLQQNYASENFKFQKTLETMKQIATNLILSTAHKLNPKRKQYCFQIFGLDYMLDEGLNPYLIQANSNPCIEIDGTVLSRVIPQMLQNAIKIAIDPIFPPPYNEILKNKFSINNASFESNKFVLVYDSYWDTSSQSQQLLQDDKNNIEDQQINQQQIQ